MMLTHQQLCDLQQQADNLLGRVLKGENIPWQKIPVGIAEDILVERISFHGIHSLVWAAIRHSDWPEKLREHVHQTSIASAGRELSHMHALGQVLNQFANAGIACIVFKGTALAYTWYANPVHRFRSDTDILVAEADRMRATAILESLGFAASPASEELIFYQQTWRQTDAGGAVNAIDLHWKFNNSELLAGLFPFEELLSRCDLVEINGLQVKVPCRADAVLIACLHSAVHEYTPFLVNGKSYTDGARLIWLFDLHMLIRHFRPQDWNNLAGHAAEKGLGDLCAAMLADVRTKFATALLPEGLELLAGDSQGKVSRYLRASPARKVLMDLAACKGCRGKARNLKTLLFPDEAYMRHKYANNSQWLILLYLRRTLAGLVRGMQTGTNHG